MLAAYGIDVHDPAVSCRRVAVLLDRLPPRSRELGERWTAEAELLAALIDYVAYLTWVTLRAAGAKNAPRPKPVPRPGQRRPAPSAAAPAADGAGDGPRKLAGWTQFADALAGADGVRVRHG